MSEEPHIYIPDSDIVIPSGSCFGADLKARIENGKVVYDDPGGTKHTIERPTMFYIPMPKQKKFHEAAKDHLISIYHGGNKGGKTIALTWHAVSFGEGTNGYMEKKPPCNIWISVPDFDMFEQYMRPWLEFWMTKVDGVPIWHFDKAHAYYWLDPPLDSRIFIKSAASGPSKYEGARVDMMGFDEEQAQDVMKAGMLRCIDANPRGSVMVTNTWKLGKTWLWYEWVLQARSGENPDIFEIQCSTYENLHLTRKYVDMFARQLSKSQRMVAIAGLPSDNADLCPFDLEQLNAMLPLCEDGRKASILPLEVEYAGQKMSLSKLLFDANAILEVWEDVTIGEEYVLVGDPSEGIGRDEAVWQIWKKRNAMLCAEWATNRVKPIDYLRQGQMMGSYYNNAMAVVLRRGVGGSICDFFGDMYSNCFRNASGNIGFNETGKTKEHMVSSFNARFDPMKPKQPHIKSKKTLTQLMEFSRIPVHDELREGKLGAPRGCMDDRAVAALVALLFCDGGDVTAGSSVGPEPGSTEWAWKRATEEWQKEHSMDGGNSRVMRNFDDKMLSR